MSGEKSLQSNLKYEDGKTVFQLQSEAVCAAQQYVVICLNWKYTDSKADSDVVFFLNPTITL